MNNVENLHAIKSEIYDGVMHWEVSQHQKRQRDASVRYLKARRGIEQKREASQLEARIAFLPGE